MNLAKDPKGYYVALGIAEDASVDDIKSAFRTKAKKLHPDHNPSPIAARQFHRVHEAYETLSDPLKRAAYDRGWRTVSGGNTGSQTNTNTSTASAGNASAKSQTQAKPNPEPKPEPKTSPRQDTAARSNTQPRTNANTSDQPAVCQCGQVTAQPRYIVFDMVWGQLNNVHRRSLAGVYCRSCADNAAIKASFVTWFASWWAWPNGPRETIKALANNIRGGRKPPERNAKLLMRQSRAFRARGDMQLARACAEQALAFASTAGLRREVDSMLLSLSSFPAREIKDRWARPGSAPFLQLAPVAVVVGGLSMAATLSAPMSLTQYAKTLLAPSPAPVMAPTPTPAPLLAPNVDLTDIEVRESDVRSGRIYAVNVDSLALRTGPGETYRIAAVIERDKVVLVTEEDAGGRWVRIMLNDGTAGFVEASGLTPNVNVDALNALGAFGVEKNVTPSPDDKK